ncbi:MAG: Spo0B domain-containing protein [Lachnospiraceae bacterium]|nr:Spo0B domain-containing protein [Lachnospiraceae bacterium]
MTISLMFGFFAVAVLAICIILLIIYSWKMKQHYLSLRESYQNLEKLNSNLRAQRHDYLNHLQVVYGLMEMEEYEELRNYLQPVYKDMLKTGKALKTSKPAINALLKAKMDEAESKGIDVYIEVKSNLQDLHVEDWELCKVLSNLLNNAMTALSEKSGEKKIELEITEDRESYLFTVSNNGPMIPKEMQESIFKQGITTKKGEGHGMGLYIVSNVLKSYKGTIKLVSKENETTFSFSLPKEERR